jgi:hypothetical protein
MLIDVCLSIAQAQKWPPQSADLSPIGWIWNVIKMKMKALNPRPRTPATMRAAILKLILALATHEFD